MGDKMWNLGLYDFIRDYDLIEYGAVVIAFVQCCGCCFLVWYRFSFLGLLESKCGIFALCFCQVGV